MASINGIQVKEYIQTLADENLVRVEKIGSGNWYWCFGSDEKKTREAQLDRVSREVEKVRASYEEVGLKLALQRAKQEEEEEEEEAEANMGRVGDDEKQREDLQRQKQELEKTVQELQTEWNRSCSCSSSTPDSKTAQEKKAGQQDGPGEKGRTGDPPADGRDVDGQHLHPGSVFGQTSRRGSGNYGGGAAGMLRRGLRGGRTAGDMIEEPSILGARIECSGREGPRKA